MKCKREESKCLVVLVVFGVLAVQVSALVYIFLLH